MKTTTLALIFSGLVISCGVVADTENPSECRQLRKMTQAQQKEKVDKSEVCRLGRTCEAKLKRMVDDLDSQRGSMDLRDYQDLMDQLVAVARKELNGLRQEVRIACQ